MKSVSLFLIALLCALLLAACASPAVQAFGPLVAQVATTRLARPLLDKNPAAAPKLAALAAALDEVAAGATGAEITDSLIRAWVAKRAPAWGLLPGEANLVTDGLLAARAEFLNATRAPALRLDDPRAGAWIAAIRDGIKAALPPQ